MKKKRLFFLFILLLLYASKSFSQSNRRVSALVIDSSKTAVSDANVLLITGTDTLRTTTNGDGYFSFSKIKTESFLLQITTLGYQNYSRSYTFGKEKHLEIDAIQLKHSTNMLKEVVISTKPNPIRIMQDTIEYNAAAYRVSEGDNVADLLKQFPGLEVDEDYNVKTMGKEMVKLRVNGKDFFTNNVKDFISKLPAGMVSKIQVIDDYGDQANFTGIKTDEPTKMLNIVTKPGMNKGQFGNARLSAGTNDQIGSDGNLNLWNDNKQSSAGLGYGTSNNGAGTSENMKISATYRDKLKKNGSIGINYGFNRNNAAFKREQSIETLNPLGTFYNSTSSNGDNNGNNHNLNTDYSYTDKKVFINSNMGIGYNESSNFNSSFSNQSGVIRQDLKNSSQSTNRTPRINASINFSRRLKNNRNSFSMNFGFSTSANNSNQNISTNTLYYDKDTQVLKKDSLLNRNLITESNNQTINTGLNFSLGLKKLKDSLARQSLNFNYSLSIGRGASEVSTIVFNNLDHSPRFIDSLSTNYTSININQTLGVSYNYSNKKIRYNIGFNARPNLMQNNYINLHQKITNNNLNYTPSVSFSRMFAMGKTLSINYSGNNSAPSIYQLQPIRNTQNLQNIVIGNPNLKPFFTHAISSNYNYVNKKSGISLQSGLRFSTTQNEIVSNVILLPDTLNSLKQETRFENTNGTYISNGNYVLNLPIKKNKYSISYSGTLGLSNRALFVNNNKRFNKGFNFSQQLSGSINLKQFSASASTNYSFSSNTNALNPSSINDAYYLNLGQISGTTFFKTENYRADLNSSLRLKKLMLNANLNYNITISDAEFNTTRIRNIKSLDVSFFARLTIKKSYFLALNASKRTNQGYSLANVNPLLLSANLSKAFLKSKTLNLTISANDLLNQGNNLSRYVSGNSIIDSRTNQVTRVVTFGLTYNLSKFGGKAFRVDPD